MKSFSEWYAEYPFDTPDLEEYTEMRRGWEDSERNHSQVGSVCWVKGITPYCVGWNSYSKENSDETF